MHRWTSVVAALFIAGCSGNDGASRGQMCSDACAAVFGCAAHFDYDLSDTVGTKSECIADCESRTCRDADLRNVTECIATLTCTSTIDAWGISALGCESGACAASLPLPFGACDRLPLSGECSEYLGTHVSPAYGRYYCVDVMGGTWIPSCPTANRVAACLYMKDDTNGARNVYYASYTGDLAQEESSCRSFTPYFRSWTVY